MKKRFPLLLLVLLVSSACLSPAADTPQATVTPPPAQTPLPTFTPTPTCSPFSVTAASASPAK